MTQNSNNSSNLSKYFHQVAVWTDNIVSFFIFITIVGLLVYMGFRLYELYLSLFVFDLQQILHEVAFLIVFVKAYRLLIFYLENHHVSIKYIMEISIIAPAIELIFATGNQPLQVNILFGLFSFANLIVYLVYYRRLCEADQETAE